MKKFIKPIIMVCMAVMIGAAVLLGACSGGYKPEGDNWYKYGNVYRVFEKVDENPQHVDKMGITATTAIKSVCAPDVKVEVTGEYFDAQSLFFDEPFLINKDGAAAIRKSLGLKTMPQRDSVFACAYTGLYTYDKSREDWDVMTVGTFSDDDPERTVIGLTAEADIYKFTYTDYDENGNRVDEGEFSVIVSGFLMVDKFQV